MSIYVLLELLKADASAVSRAAFFKHSLLSEVGEMAVIRHHRARRRASEARLSLWQYSRKQIVEDKVLGSLSTDIQNLREHIYADAVTKRGLS